MHTYILYYSMCLSIHIDRASERERAREREREREREIEIEEWNGLERGVWKRACRDLRR